MAVSSVVELVTTPPEELQDLISRVIQFRTTLSILRLLYGDSGIHKSTYRKMSKALAGQLGFSKNSSRKKGKRLLTMIFQDNSIMLLFLMPDGKAESVKRIFDYLERGLNSFFSKVLRHKTPAPGQPSAGT